VTSGAEFKTVNASLQCFKRGGKSGDLGFELNDSLGGRRVRTIRFGAIELRA
jgi:hypothetical protein